LMRKINNRGEENRQLNRHSMCLKLEMVELG
jgi:hypothetical protein